HFFAPIFLLLCKTAIVDFLWERRKINCDLPLCPSVAPASEPEPGGVGFCFTIDVGTNLKPLDAGSSPA
ncbi:hypothetical protein, partial [Cloacibacillus evryensis]